MTEQHFQIGTMIEWAFFSYDRTTLSDMYNGRVAFLSDDRTTLSDRYNGRVGIL
jgi:hypothetical protein